MTTTVWAFLAGALTMSALLWLLFKVKKGGFEKIAKGLIDKAEKEVEQKERALIEKEEAHQKKLKALAHSAKERCEKEVAKAEVLTNELHRQKAEHVHLNEKLKQKLRELEEQKKAHETQENALKQEKERVANLSFEEGKALLFKELEEELAQEKGQKIAAHLLEVKQEQEQQAATIIASAINRMAVSTVSEVTTTLVPLKNEEIKGRIIGREGRNIRALEHLTGVNFLIDDTPKAVVISGFDPVRRQVAKRALGELIHDGRIHPTSIEEAVKRAEVWVEKEQLKKGEEAALMCGLPHLHTRLIAHLGKLAFLTSYSQNVLTHSIEVSHLMGYMAAELKLDVSLAKKIGLLHDIGKGARERGLSHALVGQKLALACNEDPLVANGIGCHHGEIPPQSVVGSLASAADALSASRPAARLEAVETYVTRLQDLEVLCKTFRGVEKAYALQAGKEVRVVVTPDLFDDAAITNLARALARDIEKKLSYPGKIKVTVIRESLAVEYAL